MSFKFMKTSVALASAASLAAFGLVAAPAQAADGDVSIAPLTGTGNTVFSTDAFTLGTDIKTSVIPATTLALRIDNPDQHQLAITLTEDAKVMGVQADGNILAAADDGALNSGATIDLNDDSDNGPLVVDFADLKIVSLVIFDIASAGASNIDLTLQLDKTANVTNDADLATALSALNNNATDNLLGNASVNVTAWVETSAVPSVTDYLTVDSTYSDTTTVNFVPPTAVSPILRTERMAQVDELGAGFSGLNNVRFVDKVVVGDIHSTAPEADGGLADTGSGTDVVLGETALVLDDEAADNAQDANEGIYEAGDAPTILVEDDLSGLKIVDLATGDVYTGGGTNTGTTKTGSGLNVTTLRTAIDKITYISNPNLTDGGDTVENGQTNSGVTLATDDAVLVVDTNDGAKTAVYEVNATTAPDILIDGDQLVLADAFNNIGDGAIAGTLRFSNPDINLAQVDLAEWEIEVDSSTDANDVSYADMAKTAFVFTPNGYSSKDGMGRLPFSVGIPGTLTESATYTMALRHKDTTASTDPEYFAPGYQVISTDETASDFVIASVADTDNVQIATTDTSGINVDVRNGTSSVEFVAQVTSNRNATPTALKEANVPMLAVVTAGPTFPAGETLTVSGTTQKVETSSGSVVTSGLTNSDGKFTVKVTSSDSSSAGARYDVQFYTLEADGDAWISAHSTLSAAALYNVDYSASGSTFTFGTATTVASGSSVTLTFDVEDQFGQPLSADSDGDTYSVQLQASNDDNLDLDAEVIDGTATFTFDNFLGAGESDVLTARLYTGSATSPSFVAAKTDNVTLYNTNAVAGVNVPDALTATSVEYTDFFDGKPAAGQAVPASGNAESLTGTVVDANGAGIPGAPVTIAADGFAFLDSSTYATDSIDVIADSSGSFTVSLWSNVAGKEIAVSVTSGDVTEETEIDVSVPADISTGNVLFSWDLPETLLMNTTYAVTATVTDVFGNPINNAAVKFTGLAAAQFNGEGSIQRETGKDGTTVAYLRSLKDVSGLSAVSATLLDDDNAPQSTGSTFDFENTNFTGGYTDVKTTSWDESLFDNEISEEINFFASAADAPQTSTQKVNAGSFKGYVAVYALGYEGQRLSAKIGNDWVIVDPIVNNESANLARVTDFTGAGVDIQVRIYIDRVLIDTIPLVTK